MILADTSIWIDYLRGQNDRLAQYIQQDRLGMHSMILGELALGNFKNRQKLLRGCASLPLISTVGHEVVFELPRPATGLSTMAIASRSLLSLEGNCRG